MLLLRGPHEGGWNIAVNAWDVCRGAASWVGEAAGGLGRRASVGPHRSRGHGDLVWVRRGGSGGGRVEGRPDRLRVGLLRRGAHQPLRSLAAVGCHEVAHQRAGGRHAGGRCRLRLSLRGRRSQRLLALPLLGSLGGGLGRLLPVLLPLGGVLPRASAVLLRLLAQRAAPLAVAVDAVLVLSLHRAVPPVLDRVVRSSFQQL
mmetsp:Transcript_15074/g.38256  ORF Transcript_15074/g.38256 Transcript_15074/m.38256 type:complete len:202 (-) Transcript_15074:487-1092(-)